MPLTFLSHQAVVLPLKIAVPRWMSGTALVLGSMAPDVEYYLRTYPTGTVSHTWMGQLTFCLPVTLALYWLVTRIIAVPLAAHLPDAGQLRLSEYALLSEQPTTARHWATVAVSALIGSSSHVILDRLSGGWSMHAAADYGTWFPFSVMRADWHWVAFKLVTWIALAVATLAMLRDIGRLRLLRRWIAARNPGRAGQPAGFTPLVGAPSPTRVPTGADAFWPTICLSGVLGGVLGGMFRRSGFFMNQPATWVHIGLAAMSAAFVGLVLASLLWRRRSVQPITLPGENQ